MGGCGLPREMGAEARVCGTHDDMFTILAGWSLLFDIQGMTCFPEFAFRFVFLLFSYALFAGCQDFG